jgi:Ulp1 family protease
MPDISNRESRAYTRHDIHVFNSFFFQEPPGSTGRSLDGLRWAVYENVRKWMKKKVDIFEKKFLVTPVAI